MSIYTCSAVYYLTKFPAGIIKAQFALIYSPGQA